GFVLGEHHHAQISGVDHVGQREVHEPVDAAERDRRFGPDLRQGHQPFAFSTGQDDCENSWCGHGKHHRVSVGSTPSVWKVGSTHRYPTPPVRGPSPEGWSAVCAWTCSPASTRRTSTVGRG